MTDAPRAPRRLLLHLEPGLRENGRDWELRLEPPVNRVVPIGRTRLAALWAAWGDRAP